MSIHLWPEQLGLISDLPKSEPFVVPPRLVAPASQAGFNVIPNVEEEHPLHPAVLQPLPTIEGGWPVIMADPPWSFRSWVANANPESDRGADRHYRTMKLDEIMAMPVKSIAAPNAHLFLWITGPFLMKAAEIMRAWGFKYSSTGFVWMKLKRKAGTQYELITLAELADYLHFGMGHTTRKNVEFCLLGRRGNAKRVAKNVQEPIITPVREHSRKPDEAFERAMKYAAGPYLELFSREDREGWTTWGNETGKLNGSP